MPLESEYVLTRTSEEYQRLRRQARIWEAATKRVFDQLGIQRGMKCLDVGCGPGETMRLLGELAGPEGEVVGIDSDGQLGAEALADLQSTGTSRYRFIEADVTAPDFHLDEQFDITFARLFLLHMRDPQAVLQRIVGWTRPGGYVVLQEPDMTVIKVFPHLNGWSDFMNVLLGSFSGRGRDPGIGTKLPTMLRYAGIRNPIHTDISGKLTTFQDASPMLLSTFQSLIPQAIELGLITAERAQRVVKEIEAETRSDVPHTTCWPILAAAWAQKS
jgi:trans-aconitate methyltransferase